MYNKYGTVNYTSDASITLTHISANTYIRVYITSINYPRKYTFYLTAHNKFFSSISDLITIDVQCPLTGGATVTPPAGPYFIMFDKGVTGTAANINFA